MYRDTSAGGAFTTKVNTALIPVGTTTLVDTGYGAAGALLLQGDRGQRDRRRVGQVGGRGGRRRAHERDCRTGGSDVDQFHRRGRVGSSRAGALAAGHAHPSHRERQARRPAHAEVLQLRRTSSADRSDLRRRRHPDPRPEPHGARAPANSTPSSTTTTWATRKWVAAEGGSSVDTAAHTVTGSMNHFTQFAVGVFSATPPAVGLGRPARTRRAGCRGDLVASRSPSALPMDPNAADWNRFQIRKAGTPITIGSPVLSADHKTVYLYPDRMLDISTAYEVFVSATALGENGAALGADFTQYVHHLGDRGLAAHGVFVGHRSVRQLPRGPRRGGGVDRGRQVVHRADGEAGVLHVPRRHRVGVRRADG